MFPQYVFLLLPLAFLCGILMGMIIGLRMSRSKVKEGLTARSVKKASALDYDVIPMEGLKDE